MTWFYFFTEALHGALSNVGWQCQILCGFAWSLFMTFGTSGRPYPYSGPAIADQCLDGWCCWVLWVFTFCSDLVDPLMEWNLPVLISWWWCGCSLEVIWDTQVACGEYHMWSQHVSINFWGGGGCVTTLQCPPWLAINDAMHGNSSSSVISRHQFLVEMLEAKVSWLLCIGRLVSKHRKVMHWCSSITGQWALL